MREISAISYMAQYYFFLVITPIIFLGILLTLTLPHFAPLFQRFKWLRRYNYLALFFLITNYFELLTKDHTLKQTLAAIDYLFIGSSPSFWLFATLEFADQGQKLRRRLPLFFIIPVISCVAGLTNGLHGMLWLGLRFEAVDWLIAMRVDGYGPIGMLMFAQAYSLMVIGVWILVRHAALINRIYYGQSILILSGIILPLMINLFFITKIIPWWHKDLSAPAMAVNAIFLTASFRRNQLILLVMAPRPASFDRADFGIIVTDSAGLIADLNHAASRMLGESEKHLLGLPSEPLIERISRHKEISRFPVVQEGKIEGWTLELRERGSIAKSAPADTPVLTLGELRVVDWLSKNKSNKEIADQLGVSVSTVKFHLSNIFKKTEITSRAELVMRMTNSNRD
ncbi:MAG TPA: hypothetical protein DIC34_01955 [Treponema sp.]|nr:MAG: hypothetical protein A2Y36_10425 [Treponema sp. GWA1_62_8]OHE66816.1 MAG: hypothetical protein A2001_14250 [Treponema sp. GWC1_61_84]HCM25306.1 hypothetical protein [Treponema sp.]